MDNTLIIAIADTIIDNYGSLLLVPADTAALAIAVAMETPTGLLERDGYEAMWDVAAQLPLSPRESFWLREEIKLLKLDDLLARRRVGEAPEEPELFEEGAVHG